MIAPRHWESDRPQTWEEWSRPHGVRCMDCDVLLTNFEMTERRMQDDSMVEIVFSEEDVMPIYEIVCTHCNDKPFSGREHWPCRDRTYLPQ